MNTTVGEIKDRVRRGEAIRSYEDAAALVDRIDALEAVGTNLLEAAKAALAQLTAGYPGDVLAETWFPNTHTVHALAKAISKAEGK